MTATVKRYIASCPIFQRVKNCTTAAPGLLQPLPYPAEHFAEYSMDFIFGLPLCGAFLGVLTVVDRATKWVTMHPVTESITAA